MHVLYAHAKDLGTARTLARQLNPLVHFVPILSHALFCSEEFFNHLQYVHFVPILTDPAENSQENSQEKSQENSHGMSTIPSIVGLGLEHMIANNFMERIWVHNQKVRVGDKDCVHINLEDYTVEELYAGVEYLCSGRGRSFHSRVVDILLGYVERGTVYLPAQRTYNITTFDGM